MERINTENLNENDSQNGVLTTPRFNHEAEEHAAPVEKLPERRRTLRGFLGTPVSPLWLLAIALVTTVALGAVGGAVAGLRDNQQPIESYSLGGTVTGESNPDVAAQPAAPVAETSEEQAGLKNRVRHRNAGRTYRQIPSSSLRIEEPDVSQGQPVTRKVGVISSSSLYWYRKRRVNVEDN